jgi:hypothetical protein
MTGPSGPTGPTGFTGAIGVRVGTAAVSFDGLSVSTVAEMATATTVSTAASPTYWLTGFRQQTGFAASVSYIYLSGTSGVITVHMGAVALITPGAATFVVFYTYSA